MPVKEAKLLEGKVLAQQIQEEIKTQIAAFLAKNYRFRGAKLLVYNKKIKQALLTSGLSGLSEEKVEVVGVPRLDSYFLVPPAKLARRQVVFFSFYPSILQPGNSHAQDLNLTAVSPQAICTKG